MKGVKSKTREEDKNEDNNILSKKDNESITIGIKLLKIRGE